MQTIQITPNELHGYLVTLETGDYFLSEIRLGREDAKRYFLQTVREIVRENDLTGEETRTKIVMVEKLY